MPHLKEHWNYDVSEEHFAAIEELVGVPREFTDDQGFVNTLLAAARSDTGRFAWAMERIKETPGEMTEVSYTLYIQQAAGDARTWEIETYNPYFGCEIGYFQWRGQDLFMIYSEKHLCIAAIVSPDKPPILQAISHEWALQDDILFFQGEIPGLLSRRRLPHFEILCPIDQDHNDALVDLPPPDFAALEKELLAGVSEGASVKFGRIIISALLYPFWSPHPRPMRSYDECYAEDRRDWNSPHWLPYHLAMNADKEFEKLSDFVRSYRPDTNTPHAAIAGSFLNRRMEILRNALAMRSIPRNDRCFFFVDWSREGFARDHETFHPDMVAAWRRLTKDETF